MDFASQIKSSVDIVRTIQNYVPTLKKQGSRYVGLCPFHSEKTASFGVTPGLGIYKCFGCGVAGDVIRFVQEIEHLTFWEACKVLAEQNGIPLPKRTDVPDAETHLRSAVFQMHEIAASLFGDQLSGGSGAAAREYVKKRGIAESTAALFGLGFSEASGNELTRRLRTSFSAEQIDASGLIGRRDDGSHYDRFRNRLMFPIRNEGGSIIAFGGRALREGDEPKYLNSPETTLYKKSFVLYNLHSAKRAIREADSVILVEGYMDVIGLVSAGIAQAVATCGTALRPEQIRSMRRYSQNIFVNFDGDKAGENAAEKSIPLLIEEGMEVRVVELPDGLDPDEYIRRHDTESYLERVKKAPDYFTWLADRTRRTFDMSTAQSRVAGYQQMLLPAIQRISDRLKRATVAAEVASYLGIDRSVVLNDFRRNTSSSRSLSTGGEPLRAGAPHEQRIVLRSLMKGPELCEVLLPALAESGVARRFITWPVIEQMLLARAKGESLSLEELGRRLDANGLTVLDSALHAADAGEIFTAAEAEAWLITLSAADERSRIQELRDRLREAERHGKSNEALQLMTEIEKRVRASR